MAASASSTASSSPSPVSPPMLSTELLLCDICLEAYTERSRPPKFLACFHSFCQPCLLQVAANSNRLECPSCRKVMMLPPGGVTQLQTNFYVTHMQEAINHLAHSIVSPSSNNPKLCHRHSDQPLSFFCQSCCVPICRDCTILDHPAEVTNGEGHKIQDVKAAEAEQRQRLVTQLKVSRSTQAAIDLKRKKIKTEIGNLATAKDAAIKRIDETFLRHHQVLDNRKAELMDGTLNLYRTIDSNLKHSAEKMADSLTKLSGRLINGEKISAISTSLTDVIQTKNELQNVTDELKQLSLNISIQDNYLQCDAQQGLVDFEVAVSKLGQVSSAGDLPAYVKFDLDELIASVPCSFSLQVYSYNSDTESLRDYPIDLAIYDSTEIQIPSTISHSDGVYTIQFTPQISGSHKLVPLFINEPIKDAEIIATVKPNNPVLKIGGLGSGEGKFCCPRAIACDSEGFLFVADTGNKLIQKFDSEGNFVHQFKISTGTEDCSTCDLALDHKKGVIVCTETMVGSSVNPTMGNTVATYTTDGRLQHKFCNKVMKCALCVATNSHSEIIISDYLVHSLFMYDQHGNFLRRIGNANAFNHPAFICVGENDCLIVSDTNNDVIQIFDRQGHFLQQFGTSGNGKGCLKQPFGVADDGENILVVDSGNRRIQVFRRDGRFVSMIESSDDPLNQPRGMVLTNDGHIWVADRDSNCIKKFRYK